MVTILTRRCAPPVDGANLSAPLPNLASARLPIATGTVLHINLLGSFAVHIDGVALPRLRTRQGYRLLALMVLRRGTAVDRMLLAAVLWPAKHVSALRGGAPLDTPAGPDKSLANLRRCLTDLRRALGPAASRLHAPEPRQLQLDFAPTDYLDICDFEEAVDAHNLTEQTRAIALYRGPLLEGHNDDWTVRERRRLNAMYSKALKQRE